MLCLHTRRTNFSLLSYPALSLDIKHSSQRLGKRSPTKFDANTRTRNDKEHKLWNVFSGGEAGPRGGICEARLFSHLVSRQHSSRVGIYAWPSSHEVSVCIRESEAPNTRSQEKRSTNGQKYYFSPPACCTHSHFNATPGSSHFSAMPTDHQQHHQAPPFAASFPRCLFPPLSLLFRLE